MELFISQRREFFFEHRRGSEAAMRINRKSICLCRGCFPPPQPQPPVSLFTPLKTQPAIVICIWSNNWIFATLVTHLQANMGRCFLISSHMITEQLLLFFSFSYLFIYFFKWSLSSPLSLPNGIKEIRKALPGWKRSLWLENCQLVAGQVSGSHVELSHDYESMWSLACSEKGKWRASVVPVTRLQSGTKPRHFFPN